MPEKSSCRPWPQFSLAFNLASAVPGGNLASAVPGGKDDGGGPPAPGPMDLATVAKIEAVAANGFDPKADLLAQLLALNLEVAGRLERGAPVTAPGLPPNFPEPARLITPDCIQPPIL